MDTVNITPSDSISGILASVKPNTRIVLAPGIYREKIGIHIPDIELVGSSAADTRIVWGDYAQKLDEKGVEYNTFRTYTAAVLAPGVTFRDLTVENDALSPETKGQEVALSVVADGFLAENCRFISTQDTVFCGPLPDDLIERYDGFLKDELRKGGKMRQVFKGCYIAGNVDFIFGCGDALFDGCEIRSVYDVRGHGYAAAPAHAKAQDVGFVFRECRFTCEESVADSSIYLARPWRDYGKCSFISCEYGRHISREGFDKWNDTERDKTARFAEYGDIPSGRVPWSGKLDEAEKDSLLSAFREKGKV
ncbi:MAG: pectin esterase [Ruminiclostridium sp.]|nr:pectin esterase [Ruminiclostridium sp.]